MVYDKLTEFFEENPAVAKAIYEKAMQAARAREAAKKARELVRRKSALETSRMPGKLADCREKDPTQDRNLHRRGRFRRRLAPRWGVTPTSRPSCRCGARCSTWKRPASTRSTATTSLLPLSRRWAAALGEEFDIYQAALPQGFHHGRCRRGRQPYLHPAADLLLPLSCGRSSRTGYVYIAQPPLFKLQKGQDRSSYAYNDAEMSQISAEMGQGAKVEPLQRPWRNEPRAAVGDHHEPRKPRDRADHHRGRRSAPTRLSPS